MVMVYQPGIFPYYYYWGALSRPSDRYTSRATAFTPSASRAALTDTEEGELSYHLGKAGLLGLDDSADKL